MNSDPPKHNPPMGMEPYDVSKGPNDLGALSKDQQAKLNQFKINMRLENEFYLRNHPEIECMISAFLRDIFIKQPLNIREFAAEYFTDSNLATRVEQIVSEKEANQVRNNVIQNINKVDGI